MNAPTRTAYTDSVASEIFLHALADARAASRTIADATSPTDEYPRWDTSYYLTRDRLSGYGVRDGGELVGLFSLVRGRGSALVTQAIADGATSLDCFDGFLPEFYARHGFVEVGRDVNWDENGPDVVYMRLECENACDDGWIDTPDSFFGLGPGRCGLCNHPEENS